MTIVRTGAWGLLSILLLAQDSDVTFRSATSLVLVPFNVETGKYYAEDLQASDLILPEDRHPRDFSIFEGPHADHPVPLELDLLFVTQSLLHQKGNGRPSCVYHYEAHQWERLCAAMSDPPTIAAALHRISSLFRMAGAN